MNWNDRRYWNRKLMDWNGVLPIWTGSSNQPNPQFNLSVEPLLQIIIQAATELTNTEACSIMLIDKRTGELRFAEATGGVTEALKRISVPLENSIAGWVIRKDKPILIRDAKNDPRWHRGVDESTDFETQSILGVPLKVRDQVIGVVEVVNKKTEEGFNQDDVQLLP
jgi:signal transduction protein with GAF and PtsI domain